MRPTATTTRRPGSRKELEDEFIDRYAIAGIPEVVRGRLNEIRACGIDRVIVVPGSRHPEL
jgi:alkanesulfonate monooxygenase SsuD/methylene tetrahydromethanopterin reductase-like flavin-dependent oxidoreductase (luciferase family)